MPVQLVRSKGVGKATCLYALALEMIKDYASTKDQHVITVSYGMFAIQLPHPEWLS